VVSRSAARQVHPGFLVWVAITLGINVLALIVINWLFDSIGIEGFWSLLFAAAILTIGNTIIKPILAILTLPLIIVTFGLAYFAINVLMLALAEWLTPDFSIDGFWTYVGATIVVWLVNVAMQGLLALMSDEGQARRSSA
jgi:putative membrane protein